MYQAYLLMKPESKFDFAAAQDRLAQEFPAATFTPSPGALKMETDDWDISFWLNAGEEVLSESAEIADHIGGAEDELGIRRCNRRIEFSSDVPDPEMDHFEKFQRVLDVMRTFPGILIDPQEPSLLDGRESPI